MTQRLLILRSIAHYWRTNVAVTLGVATAVAVLVGALVVGDSVRGSLGDLVVQRLGKTDQVVVSTSFFREQLAETLQSHPDFAASFNAICPIIASQGFVTVQGGDGRSSQVRVYGVDNRFWQFHGISAIQGPDGRNALISPGLAAELGLQAGTTVLVRIQQPSDIPLESLHSRKEDLSRSIRATVQAVIPPESLGEFSLDPQQGAVRAVFLPLSRLQNELEINDRSNALLVSANNVSKDDSSTLALTRLIRSETTLDDLGLTVRALENRHTIGVDTNGGVMNDVAANAATAAAREMSLDPKPVFTYLANGLRIREHEIPYSLVAAVDLPVLETSDSTPPPMALNEWAARDLKAAVGDSVAMDYFVWEEPGQLATRTTQFRVAAIVPIDMRDRDLAPVFPGITDSPTLDDWNPPFPINLRRVRPIDEEYWKVYRTTPKAFIPLAIGRQLWQTRYGAATSIRFDLGPGAPIEQVRQEYVRLLGARLDPIAMGLAIRDVRQEGMEASKGATDFGAYFVYFSFFLVGSALLLAALFFKLSVEQRVREVGLLRAIGFGPGSVRGLFMGEGLALSFVGAVVGAFGGLGYGYLIVAALRTWWIGAVGTTSITLHVSAASVAAGGIGGIAAAMACIWLTLRGLAGISERSLLEGHLSYEAPQTRNINRRTPTLRTTGILFAVVGAALMIGAGTGYIERAGAFFGAGATMLVACLCLFVARFRAPAHRTLGGQGWWPVSRLGLRNATYRPSRSALSIATVAAAAFILISVDAFRRDASADTGPHSGTGGYSLVVESLFPIVHDPGSREGRETLGLTDLESVTYEPFRLRPGDDASCLNLYEPRNPRILAPRDAFIAEGRFSFHSSLASNDAERANPWLLLHRIEPDGAVPVIADANSIAYVLHRKLGEEITITVGGRAVRLRLVAALSDSIFQRELLMSQAHFLNLFPEQAGYRLLLAETPPESITSAAKSIEDALRDFGADATSTAERLAEFHRVENTYLSTFQMLGGLGLLLGTVGLGVVLLRNVLERRRELALLRAVGYGQAHFLVMAIAENVFLLGSGLLTGTLCALLAIVPVLIERGGRLPALSLAALLASVFLAGLIVSLAATIAALRSPLLAALRSE